MSRSARAALIVALVLVCYAPALHGGFLWDDNDHISENRALRDVSGLRDIWLKRGATPQYYPLTFTAFWIGYRLWGLDPLGYHLLNAGMHALVAILLWRMLARLRAPGAFVGACLFAAHPVNTMSVAWMTELKNTLSAALALAACLAYLKFAGIGSPDDEATAATGGRRWGVLALATVWFSLAMLAKTAVVFVPVTLWLILWWQKDRVERIDRWALGALAAAGAAMGALTIVVERLRGGDVGRTYALGLAERVIVSGRSFWFYLGKLAFPHPLIFIYPRFALATSDPLSYLPAAATAAALAGLFVARKKLGKGPFVAAMHFYVATSVLIFFVVTYFTRYSYVSDHWQYFGMMSILALAGAGVARLPRLVGNGTAVALVAILAALTFRTAGSYRDLETLYRTTIEKNPRCAMAYDNLGALLTAKGRNGDAIPLLEQALRLEPDYAEAHLNLGNALLLEGKRDDAIAHFNEAMRIFPAYAPDAHYNIGNALLGAGKVDEAIGQYEDALRLRPDRAEIHANLGLALAQQHRIPEAIERFHEALRLDGKLAARMHLNLGDVFKDTERTDDAIAEYGASLQSDPGNAEAARKLAFALASRNRWPEAIERFRQVTRIQPGSAAAHNDLGVALASAGRIAEAQAEFRDALRLDPAFEDARANLSRAEGARH